MKFPAAIIFVNSDMNEQLQSTLERQLYIHNTMSFDDFNSLISNDPSYVDQVNLNDLRILVILDDFSDYTNRDLADVVIFVAHGIANVERNKFGPPIPQITIENMNIYALLRAAGSDKVVTIPNYCNDCNSRSCSCCDCCHRFGYIYNGIYDRSGVHAPNCDNHYNNQAWLNRK